jgi:hypothetical protein
VQEWGVDQRRVSVAADAELRAHNAQAPEPKDQRHHFSKLYLPHKGMFCEPPQDLQLGSRLPVRLTYASNPGAAVLHWPALLQHVTPSWLLHTSCSAAQHGNPSALQAVKLFSFTCRV